MRKLTLLLPLLLFIFLPTYAENNYEIMPVKKIEVNPINVAVMLTEQLDSASMVSTCEYYGYVSQPSQNDYAVFKHPNGSIIRYNFILADNGKKYPTIEVKAKGTQKEKDRILESLNFKKNGNHYERKSISYQTQCSSGSNGFLRFVNNPKPKAN